MARVSAAEAAQIISQEQRQLNAAILPPTLSRIRDLMRDETFRVCNVGPWPYHIERGSLYLDIPGYDPAKHPEGYAPSAPLPEIRRESKLTGGGGEGPLEYSWAEDDGRTVALDMIGVGFGLPAHNALVQYGVFVPAGKAPTKEELRAAQAELDRYADRLIEDARVAFDKGRDEWAKVRSDRHVWAGRKRGIQERWVSEEHAEQAVRCEMCGKHNPAGVAKCQCGTILDFDLYERIEARQKQAIESRKK